MVKVSFEESDEVEFKESWSDDCLKALAAFANANGGTLYVGVRDNHEVVGASIDDKEQQSIVSKITSLGLQPEVFWETHESLKILGLKVGAAPLPIAHRGRYYVRVGSSTRDMAPDRIAKRLLSTLGQSWDSLPSKLTADDIDKPTVDRFLQLGKERLPSIGPDESPEAVLEKLKLITDGHLTNAAVLLFTKDPQRLFLTSELHIGRFKDDTHILDDKMVGGNIWTMIETALDIFRRYLQVEFNVHATEATLEGIRRQEKWEYPIDALKEALINSLIHRDYTETSKIQIRFYEDRVVFWNPGSLHKDVSLENLAAGTRVSKLRNPLISQILFYAKLVEQWGSGVPRMIEECGKEGLPNPQFKEGMGGFFVTFGSPTVHDLEVYDLSERQLQGMMLVRKKGEITNQEYRSLTGVSERTALSDLNELVEKGVLEKLGKTGRNIRYIERKTRE